jgi:predicted RNA binding protein YcfA (HicA-like mRNA interferase family)
MGKSRPQLTAADVERGLKAAGFKREKQKGTSHTQWSKDHLKVTVDAPKAPFSDDLIAMMARQAEMSKDNFYEICSKEGQKKAKKGTLGWLSLFD